MNRRIVKIYGLFTDEIPRDEGQLQLSVDDRLRRKVQFKKNQNLFQSRKIKIVLLLYAFVK